MGFVGEWTAGREAENVYPAAVGAGDVDFVVDAGGGVEVEGEVAPVPLSVGRLLHEHDVVSGRAHGGNPLVVAQFEQ